LPALKTYNTTRVLLQWPLDRILYLAASAESGSEHPLARAILRYAAKHLGGGGAPLTATEPDNPCSLGSWKGDEAGKSGEVELQASNSNVALLVRHMLVVTSLMLLLQKPGSDLSLSW
jgi:hypothetical protein